MDFDELRIYIHKCKNIFWPKKNCKKGFGPLEFSHFKIYDMSEPGTTQGPTALSFFTGYMGAAFALVFTSDYHSLSHFLMAIIYTFFF